MTAYYNEIDKFAAAWLRELIKAGHIAPGIVDERSIEDVKPEDLKGYTQVHLFAGIGVWSYAARLAGWPDNKPLWTASCPCQPFSASGKRGGFDDERHLWPAAHWHIEQCKPPVIIGEQVASKAAEPWIDLVQADLEAVDYAFGCVPFPSASVPVEQQASSAWRLLQRAIRHCSSPRIRRLLCDYASRFGIEVGEGGDHIRDRTYWVAYSNDARPQGWSERGHGADQRIVGQGGLVGGLGYSDSKPGERGTGSVSAEEAASSGARCEDGRFGDRHSDAGEVSGLGNPEGQRCGEAGGPGTRPEEWFTNAGATDGSGPTNGFWRDVDWLGCRDGKWRPVKPGLKPLVDGSPGRVGKLRGYGNAINAQAAKIFIQSAMGWL